MKTHPMQPVIMDQHNIIRFQRNQIIQDVAAAAFVGRQLSINQIIVNVAQGEYTKNDWEQFSQLTGWSVSGYNDITYIREKSKNKASAKASKLLEKYK